MSYEFEYQYETDKMRSTVFQIGVRADPTLGNVDSFAAILFFEQADGTVVEVAKIDNSEHDEGEIHIDRYYREKGADIKDFEVDVDGPFEADAYLKNNWQHFARTYLENHGTQPR